MRLTVLQTIGGAQYHLLGQRPWATICGVNTDQCFEAGIPWAAVLDQDRCHTCWELSAIPIPRYRLYRYSDDVRSGRDPLRPE